MAKGAMARRQHKTALMTAQARQQQPQPEPLRLQSAPSIEEVGRRVDVELAALEQQPLLGLDGALTPYRDACLDALHEVIVHHGAEALGEAIAYRICRAVAVVFRSEPEDFL